MNPAQALKSIGLNEKESAVYLACLELGQDTVSSIAKKATLKRPTVYLILDSLIVKGLINSVTRGKRTLYGAEGPKKLFGLIAKQERALKTVLPLLEAIDNSRHEKPKIRFYEGEEGLYTIYNEVYASKEIRYWGSIAAIDAKHKDLYELFMKVSSTKKPRVYDLLSDTPLDRAYSKKVIRPGYQIRFFPKEDVISVDSALFDNKLSMSAFGDDPHGLIIESQPIVNSFRCLWDLAWKSATPFKPSKKVLK
ncbi:helix-turn-helix domain-containing protein [Patescibacteria group bacterium]|nr:helix-turn-helix domain-containing protein [Patescibacteria group bacterium]MBU1890080.1 helix-turn-helix domain-containing protein [Patescibacteria group bacterium]